MQLISTYLLKNEITIVLNAAGQITEYRPVYNRQIQLYRGVPNTLQFRVLNADQKPVDITNLISIFHIYDETNNLIVEKFGVPVLDKQQNPIKGLFQVTVDAIDLINVPQQYVNYNIVFEDQNNTIISYADSHFTMNGSIKINHTARPSPKEGTEVSWSTLISEQDEVWYSDPIAVSQGLSVPSSTNTVVIYNNGNTGDLTIQTTLEEQIDNYSSINWVDTIGPVALENVTEPYVINITGVFSYLRVTVTEDPTDTIDKILIKS